MVTSHPFEQAHQRPSASARRADGLLETLDLQLIGTGPDRWIAEVCGVHELPGETWIQLAAAGNPMLNVLLRLPARASAAQALAALGAWSAIPREERPPVIDVMQVAWRQQPGDSR